MPAKLLSQGASEMRIKIRHKVTSTDKTQCVCACVVGGIICGALLGPAAGIVFAAAGFAGGYPGAKRDAEEEANSLISNDVPDEILRNAWRSGKASVTVKTQLRGIHPDLPPLGRLVFGDRLTKETTYYFDE